VQNSHSFHIPFQALWTTGHEREFWEIPPLGHKWKFHVNCQSSYNMNMMEHMRWRVTSKYLFHEGLAQISPHSIFSRNLHLLYWVVVGRGITNTIVVFTSCLQKFKIYKTSPGVLGPDQLWIRQNTEICKSSKKTLQSAKYWKQERQTTTS
jgi:hypothetical protein